MPMASGWAPASLSNCLFNDSKGNVNIHAGCVMLGRKGVLLLGPSGAGKSELALRLIDDGARLVADDRTDLFVRRARCSRAHLTPSPA